MQDRQTGWLKVSFFGPFYASYVVTRLDKNYQWALVTGPDKDYLWVLARQPSLPEKTQQELIDHAARLGYNTDNLIFVEHSKDQPADTGK